MVRKKTGGKKTFIGFDTETVNNGQIVLIANSEKEYLVLPTIDEVIEFLLKYEDNQYLGYFYNLDYDTKSLIMTIAENNNNIEDIKTFLFSQYLTYKNYTINYIPKKKLTIYENLHLKEVSYKDKYGNWCKRNCVQFSRKAEFYDIAQFYLNEYGKVQKLNQTAQQYLGYGKLEVEDIGNIDINKLNNDRSYRNLLIEYCIRDSFLVKRLCYVFYNDFSPFLNNKKLLSPAFISQKYIQKQLLNKGIQDQFTNKYIMKYEKEILSSYYGGRFETFKKGLIGDKGYIADINSAYPFIMSQFHGLTGKATITNGDNLELDKCYPLIEIEYYPNDLYLNPLPFKTSDNLVYFPSNKKTVTKWIPPYSIELLDMMGIDYSINKIIKFWKTDNLLFDFIHELYKLKKESTKYKKIAKIILNSMYGKTIEKTKRVILSDNINSKSMIIIGDNLYFADIVKNHRGQLYNPLWGTLITDYCRTQIVKPIIKQNLLKNLYQIATDSILLDKKPDLVYDKNIGNWSLDEIEKPIVYGNGILEFNGGFKSRGFACTDENGKPDIDLFHKTLSTGKFKKTQLIPMNHYNRYGFKKIHSFQHIEKNFSIKDRKRQFKKIAPLDLLETTIDSNPMILT